MIKPLGQNILVKKIDNENNSKIIFQEESNIYLVLALGNQVKENLINKKVFIKTNLIKIDYQDSTFYLVKEEDILAVLED